MNSWQLVETTYKYQKWIWTFFGLWKLTEKLNSFWHLLYNIFAYFVLIVFCIILDVSLVVQFIRKLGDIYALIKVFFLFAALLASHIKILSIKVYVSKYEDLLRFLNSHIFVPRNPDEEKLLLQGINIISKLRNVYFVNSFMALNFMLLTNAVMGIRELPLNVYVPHIVDQDRFFVAFYIYLYVSVLIGCLINVSFDTVSPSFLILVKVQFDILENRLRNIGESMAVNNELIYLQLKECVEFRANIMSLLQKIEAVIRLPCSLQIFCSILALVVNFYAMVLLTDLKDYATLLGIVVFQICMLLQIFLTCYFSNEVTLSAARHSYALYNANWTRWDKKNRKLALLMMSCFDMPVKVKSLNTNYAFDLSAFTSIVNSSYSYFALLKRVT